MFIDARTIEGNARIEADVCIIGGGAAGLATAYGLRRSGARVVVLESGGRSVETPSQRLSAGSARGPLLGRRNRYLTATRVRTVGGLAGTWNGTFRPFDGEDLATRDWVENSGWPLASGALAPYYPAARELLGLEPAVEPRAATLLADADLFADAWLTYAAPESLDNSWQNRLVRAAGARVYTHSTVVSLVLDPDGGQLESATVASLEGAAFTVRARHFVLAAGALENARLLLASNQQRAAGLGNERDLVGRYFSDQVVLRAGFAILPGQARALADHVEPAAGAARRAALRPAPALQRRHELLNSLITLEPAAIAEGGRLAAAVGRSAAALGRLGHPSTTTSADDFFGAVTLRGEQRPNRDSRVTLGDDCDALGLPRIALSWQLDEHDHWSLRTTATLFAESLGRRGLGRLQLRAPRLHRRHFGWSGHQSGTTRMSREAATGVVNADCRLHEVPNLFVAGSSVFPTSGCSGPMLTVVALALRLGEHLEDRLET